jgi:glutaminyl-peptide cyclotransferase
MRIRVIVISVLCTLVLAGCATIPTPTATPAPKIFDGSHAYQNYFLVQMKIGVRPAGSAADRATGDYILAQLKESKWKAETQEFTYRNVPVRNVIAKAAEGRGSIIIIGAHYDTRPRADQDKTNPTQPILGANDGASGVAVLLELARTLDIAKLKNEVWLAFFDAEDNGDLSTCDLMPAPNCDKTPWTWSIGATYVAEHLPSQPAAVIVIDMIGDADQNIYYERNSDQALQQQIWGIAAKLGYTRQFIPEYKWSMSDDHTPFLQRGIRAVDMIDFDYPYWHTTQDTADKVSAESLERVGRVLQTWIENQ